MKRWLMLTILGLALMLALGAAGAQDMMYGEAPMLAALVEAGELPPVEERLPAEPLVITPTIASATTAVSGARPWSAAWIISG